LTPATSSTPRGAVQLVVKIPRRLTTQAIQDEVKRLLERVDLLEGLLREAGIWVSRKPDGYIDAKLFDRIRAALEGKIP
jgi:hypothetical protein